MVFSAFNVTPHIFRSVMSLSLLLEKIVVYYVMYPS